MLDLGGSAMTGELAISAAPFYGNRFLLPRLAFAQEDLLTEGLDGAIRFGTGDWPGLDSRLIHRDRIGPV